MILDANLKALASQQRLVSDVQEIEGANALGADENARVAATLRTALEPPAELANEDEDGWHRWWYDRPRLPGTDPPPQVTVAVNASPQPLPLAIASCFVAGTLVRTVEGRKPIETVRVGDQVLTLRDVTSSVLAFQPITVVHRNPPAETIRVTLDNGDSVVASIYHRFYRAGLGWAMARELKTGDTLRTLGGLARVVALESAPTRPVFNLDVASSRTYFVGAKDALVHDNTLPDTHSKHFDATPAPVSPPTPTATDTRP